jgi:cytochrome c oxidase assembly protein subunit 15
VGAHPAAGPGQPPWLATRWLAPVAAVGMFAINLVGFLDTQTNSAFGCGRDWPLCNGRLIPALSGEHVAIEFAHRMLVAGFALLAAAFLLLAWWQYRAYPRVRLLALVGAGFIVVQSGLGAAAVIWYNPPAVLALHLGFGFLAMAGVSLLAAWIRRGPGAEAERPPLGGRARAVVMGAWLYLYAAIYWGSYVAFRNAGGACGGWPLCNGHWLPNWQSLAVLDWVHRLAAVGLLGVAVAVWAVLRRWRPKRADLERLAAVVVGLVLVQMLTGANLVWQGWTTGPYLLHVFTLMLLFLAQSQLALEAGPWPAPAAAGARRPAPG